MSENRKEKYELAIQHNLCSFLETENYYFGPTVDKRGLPTKPRTQTELANKLEKRINTDDNEHHIGQMNTKLGKLLTAVKPSIDPFFINEICELYKFPIEKIFTFEKITVEQAKEIMEEINGITAPKERPFSMLSKKTHYSYFGDFYGYTFEHNPNEKDCIKKFQLSIFEDDNGSPKAVYKHHNSSNNELSVFSGIPYYASEQKAICIEMLTDDKQKYQYIYFNGKPYSSTKLTYKSGACVRTSSASRNDEPDVKNFIITGFELPDNTLNEIVPGLLKMSSDSFYITSAQLEKLESEKPELKVFHKKHDEDFHLIDNSVFLVKELKIIRSTEFESNDKRIYTFECLTKIKAHALSPNRVIYRNTEADYNFFKQLEQNGN